DLISVGQSAGWLIYEGWLPLPELLARLSHFHAGICPVHNLPNYRHNLLTKVLDYLSAGLPVVSSNLPGIMDQLGSSESIIYFEAGNTYDLVAAIKQLMDESFRRLAADGAYNLAAKFSWASQSKVLEKIYVRYLG
ncbi:glycosyltransferase, partial [Candidatus Neomarinimicrobiota bacterium]